MAKKILLKMRTNTGFTLSETLMVVMIVLLVSVIVATGIPVALRSYNKVVDTANAQSVLASVSNTLRVKLSTSSEIEVHDNVIYFQNNDGLKSEICLRKDESGQWMICCIDYPIDYKSNSIRQDVEYWERPIISKEAANTNLHVQYENVIYENGIVKFHHLQVLKQEKVLAETDTFMVYVFTDTLTHER